jgi:hypothetical protein
MKLNKHRTKIARFPRDDILLVGPCSGFFFRKITRTALQTMALGITVMLSTSCASTNNGVNTTLVNQVANDHHAINSEDDGWYQPSRSPEFDPDLLGGE